MAVAAIGGDDQSGEGMFHGGARALGSTFPAVGVLDLLK
jgi:hypothetical protein